MTNLATDLSAAFWEGLRQRRLMLQVDRESGRAQFYPRPISLYSNAGVEWREASGRGTLLALTLSRVAPPPLARLAPYPLALVTLLEGPRLLARINAPMDTLKPGMAVEVDWDASAEGAFPVFKPVAA